MAKKKCKCECPAGEKWAVPYADFLSLLLALFIALYALASINVEKQKALKEEFMKIYNFAASDTIKEQEETEKSMTTDPTNEPDEGRKPVVQPLTKQNELENKNAKGGNLLELSDGTFMSVPA
ncbi:flagellar motor protein MotB, partial [Aliarcobacter butzleri]